MRRHEQKDGVKACLCGIAEEHFGMHSSNPRAANLVVVKDTSPYFKGRHSHLWERLRRRESGSQAQCSGHKFRQHGAPASTAQFLMFLHVAMSLLLSG